MLLVGLFDLSIFENVPLHESHGVIIVINLFQSEIWRVSFDLVNVVSHFVRAFQCWWFRCCWLILTRLETLRPTLVWTLEIGGSIHEAII